MKVCIYARVSTSEQELEQQIAAVRRFCDYRQFEIAHIYTEKVSAVKSRPVYQEMVTDLRAMKYDGVVVFRLDRLGRNSRELALIIDELESKGVKVLSISESFDTTTALGRAMRELVYIFAQLEREQISEATKQRLTALQHMGKKLGPPVKVSPKDADTIQELRRQGLSLRAIARAVKLGKSTVARVLNNEQS